MHANCINIFEGNLLRSLLLSTGLINKEMLPRSRDLESCEMNENRSKTRRFKMQVCHNCLQITASTPQFLVEVQTWDQSWLIISSIMLSLASASRSRLWSFYWASILFPPFWFTFSSAGGAFKFSSRLWAAKRACARAAARFFNLDGQTSGSSGSTIEIKDVLRGSLASVSSRRANIFSSGLSRRLTPRKSSSNCKDKRTPLSVVNWEVARPERGWKGDPTRVANLKIDC